MTKPIKLLVALVVPQLAGLLGSLFTTSNIPTWYAGLVKPSFNPPSWVFGPVWTILFILMGVSLYLVWTRVPHFWQPGKKKERRLALTVFGAQLALNSLWSILFFGLQSPGAALVEIVVLWAAILVNIILFYRAYKPAGLLLVPYILWVSFAAFLNYSIWQLQ